MPTPITVVDSFTDRPFAGNPAAVCFLTAPADEKWMAAVAAEMNLAETAFLVPQGTDWGLRWFTPNVEVDLCGHATLASAHALWESGRLAPDAQARFHTKSGLLTADRRGDWIALDFPNEAPSAIPTRLALVRAAVGDRRRPGDRLRALRPRPLVAGADRPGHDDRISGLRSRRHRPGDGERPAL
jgi:predicted PhzF superfamily epimerase YddE/YHI9